MIWLILAFLWGSLLVSALWVIWASRSCNVRVSLEPNSSPSREQCWPVHLLAQVCSETPSVAPCRPRAAEEQPLVECPPETNIISKDSLIIPAHHPPSVFCVWCSCFYLHCQTGSSGWCRHHSEWSRPDIKMVNIEPGKYFLLTSVAFFFLLREPVPPPRAIVVWRLYSIYKALKHNIIVSEARSRWGEATTFKDAIGEIYSNFSLCSLHK